MAQSSKFAEKLLAETTAVEEGTSHFSQRKTGNAKLGVSPQEEAWHRKGEANGMERTCEGALTLVAETKTTSKHILRLILWIPVNVTQFLRANFVTLTRMSH